MTEDSDLFHIFRIKENKDQVGIEESLKFLIDKHSGIYLDMSKKFLPINADFRMDQQDVRDEMLTFFWEVAMDYNPDAGCKFSSRLGDKAKWKFLRTNRNAEPINNVPNDDTFWEHFENEGTGHIVVSQEAIDLAFDKVKELGSDLTTQIFELRYKEGNGGKLMPWKMIGNAVGRTYENCRQIHNAALEVIRQNLANKETS